MNYNERLSGNEAIAFAMKQIDPRRDGGLPHHPLHGDSPVLCPVRGQRGSEHRVCPRGVGAQLPMSTCIGAEAAGARAMTATSSCRPGFYVRDDVRGRLRPAAHHWPA